jgi:hypothetical protein
LIARLWPNTSPGAERHAEVSALGYDLQALRDALKLIAPSTDWSWLLSVAKRMTAAAPAQRTKYHLITSDRLYLLGLELMDCAAAEVNPAGRVTKAQAFRYRDGLIIALLAMIPLRSGTLTALRIGHHLVKVGVYGRLTYRLRIQRADGRWIIRFLRGNLGAHRSVSGAIPQPYPRC